MREAPLCDMIENAAGCLHGGSDDDIEHDSDRLVSST
jgi:hypothetical protein